ncbi:secretin N-terminal domain-containing protein [endosymbiont of unidentified scaly snail isolate Monju]|uniref:secretin N-terminal domain-containing protein n=1 Tax=endosymbiont of unidentified scaly snail isolate Monju TaxID=1248727 RepID=UPI0003891B7F|nr:secretin N-terminal domain-containing protein [endosymbiont of unidentified scaly snail isolate Monju]BAN69010.1 secretion system family protein [endosymbiont of unidentified scaly snail isolate Monju]
MMSRIRLLITCLLLGSQLVFAATETALFTVRHRPAADLVPQLREVLGKDGGVSAWGDRLIVRAPAERLDEIRWLIGELDQPLRRLLIEVEVGRERGQRKTEADLHTHDGRARLRFMEGHTRQDGERLQRVRTLDGRPALIRIGRSVPIYTVEQHRYGNQTEERLSVRYKDLHTGILVLPRVHGDRVTLEVYQQDQREASGGRFALQDAETVASGRLGEWLSIGSIETQGSEREQGIGLSAHTRAHDEVTIRARVIALD